MSSALSATMRVAAPVIPAGGGDRIGLELRRAEPLQNPAPLLHLCRHLRQSLFRQRPSEGTGSWISSTRRVTGPHQPEKCPIALVVKIVAHTVFRCGQTVSRDGTGTADAKSFAVGQALTCFLFSAIESLFEKEANEITLPHRAAQSVDARFRAFAGTQMDRFVEYLGLGHISTNSGIAFFHPALTNRSRLTFNRYRLS